VESRDATWMAMIRSRHPSSRTYNLEQALAIARDGITRFYPTFSSMNEQFTGLATAER